MFPLKKPEDDQNSSFHMGELLGFAQYFGQLGRNALCYVTSRQLCGQRAGEMKSQLTSTLRVKSKPVDLLG